MANRRMLSKSISISEQANDLSDFAALLFTWMIPHADDWGVLPGSARKIKALVIPLRPQSADDVESALLELVEADLLWRYEVDGQLYIQFRTWEKHQDGLHKRSKPKFPLYPGNSEKQNNISESFPEIPGNSGSREENLREENRTEYAQQCAREEIDQIVTKELCQVNSGFEVDLINDWAEHFTRDWVIEAIKIAVLKKSRNLKFVDGILRSWLQKGFKPDEKPWEVENRGKPISKTLAKARDPAEDYSEYDR